MKQLSVACGVALTMAMASPALALNARTWISGHGADQAGCGPVASPCRTLQYAHDQTSAGGEINILDPAGYGAVAITKAMVIVNEGVGVAGVLAPAAANAITINAGTSEKVILRGLTIEGGGAGYNGVAFFSGRALEINNCSAQGFYAGTTDAGNGILIAPSSGQADIVISHTVTSNNGFNGIYLTTPAGSTANVRMTVVHSEAFRNAWGIAARNTTTAAVTHVVNIANTVASHNTGNGYYLQANQGRITMHLDNSHAFFNGTSGVYANGPATVLYIGRTVVTNNERGIILNSGVGYSYGDNYINDNVSYDAFGLTAIGRQ